MSTSKTPIDLHAVVQTRLDQLAFVKPLLLKDVPKKACGALTEGTSSDFTQGVRLNDSVAIFLDWWGYGMSNRYSFAVFEKAAEGWQLVHGRIEDINVAVACAIHTLAEQPLRSTGCRPRTT